MQELTKFIRDKQITMRARRVAKNPYMADDSHTTRHFLCTFRRPDHCQISVHFSQGSGWSTDPTVEDVLDCLASDSATIDNARNFEDWCGELGFDTDSRKAEKSYKACQRQDDKLRAFMGADFQTLLYEVERQ